MVKKKKEHQTFDRMADLRTRKSKRTFSFGNDLQKRRKAEVSTFPAHPLRHDTNSRGKNVLCGVQPDTESGETLP